MNGGAFARLLSRVMDIVLILIVAFLIALKFRVYFTVKLILIVVSAIYLLRNLLSRETRARAGCLNLLDLAVSLVVLSEAVNYLLSTYQPNSLPGFGEILFMFLFYWLLRFNFTHEYQRTAIFIFLTVVGGFIAGVAFWSFPGLYQHLRELGFYDITNFRNHIYVFNPVGLSIGEWSTVLLLLLPFPLILIVKYRAHRYVTWPLMVVVAAILLTMVLTFIRGVYIAAAVFVVLGSVLFWVYRVFPPRKIVTFNLAIILLVLIGIVPVWRPTLVTLSLFKTSSQVRSFATRQQVWKESLRMFRDYPLTGVGAGNFTMKYVGYRTSEDEAAFALRPFNVFLHILVERGLVGLLAYGFLFFSFIFVSYRKLKRFRGDVYRQSIVLLFVTAVVSVIVRDLSESSIFINYALGTVLWFIFANIAADETEVSV